MVKTPCNRRRNQPPAPAQGDLEAHVALCLSTLGAREDDEGAVAPLAARTADDVHGNAPTITPAFDDEEAYGDDDVPSPSSSLKREMAGDEEGKAGEEGDCAPCAWAPCMRHAGCASQPL